MKKAEILKKVWRRFAIIHTDEEFSAIFIYEISAGSDFLVEYGVKKTKYSKHEPLIYSVEAVEFCDLDGYELSDLIAVTSSSNLHEFSNLATDVCNYLVDFVNGGGNIPENEGKILKVKELFPKIMKWHKRKNRN